MLFGEARCLMGEGPAAENNSRVFQALNELAHRLF
jgi:hypothetical protein